MNVLTATSHTQGWRDNDFCWSVEGELVFMPPIECAPAWTMIAVVGAPWPAW
jgi:hypothetical protein